MRRALVFLLLAGCYDPVHLDAVKALGEEDPAIPRGPLHRQGQPCTTCHGGDGPADLELALGGTVYAVRGGKEPLDRVRVVVRDARGETREMRSNERGNFYLPKSEWAPAFPLNAEVIHDASQTRKKMATVIGRDGGCAACHRDAGDATFMPGIFVRDQ